MIAQHVISRGEGDRQHHIFDIIIYYFHFRLDLMEKLPDCYSIKVKG